MRHLVALALVVLLAVPVSAQFADEARLQESQSSLSLGSMPVKNPFSLIDMSKLHFSHSYSLAFTSGGAGSGTAGLLNTTMLYELSPSLSLAVNVGVSHTAGSIYDANANNSDILPGFALDYHPSEKFRMSISYQRVNGALYPAGYGWSNWHRSNWYDPF